MEEPDIISLAIPMVSGFHNEFNLLEQELEHLYTLIGARLLICQTKCARNKLSEPDNTYLFEDEKPGWALLNKLINIDEKLIYLSCKRACAFS